MWIVKLALRRPYTFVVMALLILILGGLAYKQTPTDIFPAIKIPVVALVWQYQGIPPQQFEKYITTFSEFTISSGINDVKSIESQTVNGACIIKVFFQPTVDIGSALSQITALSQIILRRMPLGTTPPFVFRYDASSVPVLQIALASNKLSEQQLYDTGLYKVRTAIAPVRGSRMPLPYGGKPRQIQIDADPQLMTARGVTMTDINAALTAQNSNLPTGMVKIGERDYIVGINSNPTSIDELNDIPIKQQANGAWILLRDVANVRDGFGVQTNIVRDEGRRSALLTILKAGSASTLDVVEGIKNALVGVRAASPDMQFKELFDQSVFVKAAIDSVLMEGLIAACLTALMILLFLGSWRSTIIVAVSIPLSILTSLCVMYLTGETLNIMTLGGLALAVGILVDDATVAVENIHRYIEMGHPLEDAIIEGSQQIAVPAFVSTLAICIVFVSVIFLTGPAKFLFTPMALVVAYAMLASYVLSRTLVPVMVKYLLVKEAEEHGQPARASRNPFVRFHHGFERGFESFRNGYVKLLNWGLFHRLAIFLVFGAVGVVSMMVLPFVGRDFFPLVDAGQIRMHVTVPAGTRLEETELIFGKVENVIREIIPDEDRRQILDNIGLPQAINMAFTDTPTISSADGEILISLSHERKLNTQEYIRRLRAELPKRFPTVDFFFQPADIVNQILNFGLPAPIDVQIIGGSPLTAKIAKEVKDKVAAIPGAVDVHVHQITNGPALQITVDRQRSAELGLTQREVANNVLTTLSSSAVVNFNLWPDPKSGLQYPVAVQTPQYLLSSIEDVMSTNLPGRGQAGSQMLSNVASIERRETPLVISHTNVQPTFDVFANVQGTDLGTVASQLDKLVAEYCPPRSTGGGSWFRGLFGKGAAQPAPQSAEKGEVKKDVNPICANLPPGIKIEVRGQVESMKTAFTNLGFGILFAAMLVYFIMVVNFQSWTDPFIIITALPGALCGIVWILFLTGTTFSVPSLMGTIMSVGVATANSILIVSFAKEQLTSGKTAMQAALAAGFTRLRPVLMTASAMIIGMVPMALGWGEGGEQNAPLGRAVIGGLIFATVSTLLFVPVIFSLIHGRRERPVQPLIVPTAQPA
ncbi:MAG: efflux RND transporter permease subunit [Pseudomonadota bacterium]|nr:efflux RND transporter permease subunit [Pseudomonadota bacterium]